MRKNLVLKLTEAAYQRSFEAWVEVSLCSVCGESARCLCTDGSSGEYGGPSFCATCLKNILKSHIEDETQHPVISKDTLEHK
jgi:superfamily II helicase